MFNVLKYTRQYIEKSPAFKHVLPKPPRVAFCNLKTLPNKLVRSKIRDEEERGNFPSGHSDCEM